MATRPVDDVDEKNILAINELRRRYDKINTDYNQLRTRVLAVLGGELAFVTFLFAKGGFAPHEQYGQIFYYSGIALLLYTFLILFKCTFSSWWALPVESKELSKLHERHDGIRSFQDYVKEEYLDAIAYCTGKQNEKATNFNVAIQALIVGGIILMVIKFTNGG